MANGENRAKIKQGATAITRGMKRVTIGVAEKIHTCIDAAVVQPTMRVIDFDADSNHKDMEKSDAFFHAKVKKAQAEGNKFMKVVFAQPVQSGFFEAKNYLKSDEDIALIDASLDDNFVFSKLPASKRTGLIDAFEPIIVKPGTKIIEEGEAGDYFYVVGSGIVDILIDGKEVGTAEEGSSFGELALLYQAPRAATCVAKTMCGLFRLDQETFKRTMAQQVRESQADVLGILKSVEYFADLGDKALTQIASSLRVINYKSGDLMVSRAEDTPRRFYILKSGSAVIQGINIGGSFYNQITVAQNEYFGEMAMLMDQWVCEFIVAKGDVVALVLDREQFMQIVGDEFGTIVKKVLDKKALAHIPFGKRKNPVDENELDLLAGAIVEKSYKKGHVFFTEGSRCTPSLYLIREGKVSIESYKFHNLDEILGFEVGKEKVKTIKKMGYFGNDTMGANETGELGVAQYTVIALEDVEVGLLDFNAIKSIFAAERAHKIQMDELNMVRILGAGTFGKVWLVSHKKNKETYALKIQVKHFLIKNNQADGVIREKDIMAKFDHPFLIKMISHWKDDDKLYMLLKLYQGGELNSVIHSATRDGIPERAARFYAANILEGLSYMHRRHIIYRDLKPANVMLDADGYTVIVDFGFAKLIKNKTYTFCGTPLYLAPEIITQDGHNAGADHWAWGVMLYEMIVGMTPFYDGIVDQMGLFKNIIKGRFDFPEGDFVSLTAKDLITRMLTTDPKERLGSFVGGERDIKSHPFFDGFDWGNLLKKNVKVPFKPKISDPLDGSNFDDFSKLEAKSKNERYPKLTGAEQRLFDKF